MSFKSAFYLFIMSSFITLSACQTTNYYGAGKGPITLSGPVANYYQNKFKKEFRSELFLVNRLGTNARYTMCSEADCIASDDHYWLYWCKEQIGEECFIFARKDQIVWQGPVTMDGRNLGSLNTKLGKPDSREALCRRAVDLASGTWEQSSALVNAVKLAKKSGLTESDCRNILKLKPLSEKNTDNNSSLTDLNKSEAKCSELGFSKGTEKYADCVIKMMGRL